MMHSSHSDAEPVLARVFRGELVESEHRGHIVIATPDGRIRRSWGRHDTPVFLRSAAKPFQAAPLLDDQIQSEFGFSGSEMALTCASHNGEPMHADAAGAMLAKIGLDANALQCGTHRPLGVDLGCVEDRHPYTVLQNNCSGKHAGMLAACKKHGWPTETYLDPAHPHQRRILDTLSEACRLRPQEIGIHIDGCSAPVFHMPLDRLATAYANLANADWPGHGNFGLMTTHPEMVAGTKRFDTAVMRAAPGLIAAKIGAEGLECIAVRVPEPLGIVVKISDGSNRANPPVVIALLKHMGLLDPDQEAQLADFAAPARENHRKIPVGDIRCAIDF